MKKILNTTLIALTLLAIRSLDARTMIQKTPITANDRAMFTATKQLKNPALTETEKAQAAAALEKTLKKDPLSQLFFDQTECENDIKEKKAEIATMKSPYFGFWDSEEAQLAKEDLKELEEELNTIQKQIHKIKGTQPPAVTNMKKWAVATFIAVTALADHYFNEGKGRNAIIGAASAGASTIKSGLAIGWSSVPQVSLIDVLQNAATAAGTIITTTGTLLAAYSYYNQLNDIIAGMNKDPNADQELLQKTIADRDLLSEKLEAFKKANPEEYKKIIKN